MDAGDPLDARARFLAAVSRLEAGHDEPARLCEACVQVLPVQRAAIAVHVDGSGLEVLCASDGVAEEVEWTQITLGEGPGVEAVATGGPIIVAELVTAILLTAGRTGRITESLGPWWDQPLSTREVHQATGMIVAQLGVTAHEAFVRMQGFAYSNGRMLSEVAQSVVHRQLRFDRELK